jgi:hypothetical protein
MVPVGSAASSKLQERSWSQGQSSLREQLECDNLKVFVGTCLPTMEGKTALGASSPAKPALHIPDPLSTTSACTSSSACSRGERKKAKRFCRKFGVQQRCYTALARPKMQRVQIKRNMLQQCTVKLNCAAVHRHSMQGNGCSQNKDTYCRAERLQHLKRVSSTALRASKACNKLCLRRRERHRSCSSSVPQN